ncbi:MAG: hypothetical protein ACLP36_14655 [Acidimicrobiales bacterium]
MTSTLTGILIGAALIVVALVRGSRPYEETFTVPGGLNEWLQKCHDALEGAPHFSDVKVSDDPVQVQARYRQRPGVWGRLTVTMLPEGSAFAQIMARAKVAPTPVTAIRRPESQIVGQLIRQLGLRRPGKLQGQQAKWLSIGFPVSPAATKTSPRES